MNSARLLTHLKLGALCDDCLSVLAGITPRQTVNALCRRLADSSQVSREHGECKRCGKTKLVNSLLSETAIPSSAAQSDQPFTAGHRDEPAGDESWLQGCVFMELYSYFRSKTSLILYHDSDSFRVSLFERMFDIQREAELKYYVGADRELSHKCDLVLAIWEQKLHYVPILNVEIKFRSAVTDAFKARSYDQIHLKRAYPHLLGVLAYAKPQHSGISFDQARQVCNAFDFFVFVREEDLYVGSVWNPLVECFHKRMESVSKDPSIPPVSMEEDSHI